jgi:hypothetical protein
MVTVFRLQRLAHTSFQTDERIALVVDPFTQVLILRGCWKTRSSEPSDQEMDHGDLDHGLAVSRMDFIIS